MSALNMKQRAKVNAALAIIHAQGHDVNAVQAKARTIMATGRDARYAYERAINGYVSANPDLGAALLKITGLIEASDAATVAKYDHAISAYIETGDAAAIDALEPMMRQDSVALAVRNGEVTPENAAAGMVDWGSLGFQADRSAPQTFAFASAPTQPALPDRAPAAPSGFQRNMSIRNSPAPAFGNTQVGPGSVRAASASATRFAATPVPTIGRQSPYAGMNPAQMREAMRADMAVQPGWQRDAGEKGEP